MTNRLEMRKQIPIVWKWENRLQSSENDQSCGNAKTDYNRLEMRKPIIQSSENDPSSGNGKTDSIRLEMTNRLEMRKQIPIVWKCEN